METTRSAEIRLEIGNVEGQISYLNSMIALCLAEANLLDAQVIQFTEEGLMAKTKLRDLQAELADTI